MRLALFGPPGAGKGTQAQLLVERFGLAQISTGDLFRAALSNETEVGLEAKGYMDRGALVPDAVVNRMVEEALADRGYDGFILDGFPRTLPQAEWLHGHLEEQDAPLHCVLSLEVEEENIVQRLSLRRSDPETGAIYHLDFNPPPPEVPRERLVHRDDDRPDTIRARLAEYEAKTAPVKNFFKEHAPFAAIDGEGGIQEVHARVVDALEERDVSAA